MLARLLLSNGRRSRFTSDGIPPGRMRMATATAIASSAPMIETTAGNPMLPSTVPATGVNFFESLEALLTGQTNAAQPQGGAVCSPVRNVSGPTVPDGSGANMALLNRQGLTDALASDQSADAQMPPTDGIAPETKVTATKQPTNNDPSSAHLPVGTDG